VLSLECAGFLDRIGQVYHGYSRAHIPSRCRERRKTEKEVNGRGRTDVLHEMREIYRDALLYLCGLLVAMLTT
jgi:hypothetical protein